MHVDPPEFLLLVAFPRMSHGFEALTLTLTPTPTPTPSLTPTLTLSLTLTLTLSLTLTQAASDERAARHEHLGHACTHALRVRVRVLGLGC